MSSDKYVNTLLNWLVKGVGIFVVILLVQMIFGAILRNFGIIFTMQLWPFPTDFMSILGLLLSAIAVGAVGAWVFDFVDRDLLKTRHGSMPLPSLPRHTRRAISKDAKTVLIVLIIVGGAIWAYQQGYLNVGPAPQQGKYSYQAPLKFSITDALAGGAFSPSSVLIYSDPTQPAIDSVTISSGTGTSTRTDYTSGSWFWYKVYDSTTKVLLWGRFQVPYSSSLTAPSSWPVSISVTNPPASATISASVNGTAFASGSLYSLSGQGNVNPNLLVQVINPTDNRGFGPTPGPDLGVSQWELGAYVLLGNESAYKVTLTGPTMLTRLSSTDIRYYTPLDANQFLRQKDPSGVYKGTGGTVTFTISINGQGLATGNNATITILVYAYTSSQYYMTHGFLYGPNAFLLGTYVINLQG